MNRILYLILFFFLVGCNNPMGPRTLVISPEVAHLDIGQSQVFNISGLNGQDFRVFINFYKGESICYSDCDPNAYGIIEKLGSGSLKYTLRKGKDFAKYKVIQLEVYTVDSNEHKAAALIYPN